MMPTDSDRGLAGSRSDTNSHQLWRVFRARKPLASVTSLSGRSSCQCGRNFSFLGGQSVLVTAVGKNPLGLVISQDLERYSVFLHDIAPRRKENCAGRGD
jgi:hypothetical protein